MRLRLRLANDSGLLSSAGIQCYGRECNPRPPPSPSPEAIMVWPRMHYRVQRALDQPMLSVSHFWIDCN